MAKEIERKFLVQSNQWQDHEHTHIRQGYLSTDPKRTIRIRITDHRAFLTIKGQVHNISRDEYEYTIPKEDAKQLLELCTGDLIEKTRFFVEHQHHTFDIDVFEGDNSGLILAEIELQDENETFEKPEWLGEEVTHDSRYLNCSLSKNPYKNWRT